VRLLPVTADEVGIWSIISEHAAKPGEPPPPQVAGPEEAIRLDRIHRSRETLRIPIATVRESTGYFIFYAGRAARPGEELLRDGELHYKR